MINRNLESGLAFHGGLHNIKTASLVKVNKNLKQEFKILPLHT